MRTKQKHFCWGCGSRVETFIKTKRVKNFVKVFQHVPDCAGMKIVTHFQDHMIQEAMIDQPKILQLCKQGGIRFRKNQTISFHLHKKPKKRLK